MLMGENIFQWFKHSVLNSRYVRFEQCIRQNALYMLLIARDIVTVMS